MLQALVQREFKTTLGDGRTSVVEPGTILDETDLAAMSPTNRHSLASAGIIRIGEDFSTPTDPELVSENFAWPNATFVAVNSAETKPANLLNQEPKPVEPKKVEAQPAQPIAKKIASNRPATKKAQTKPAVTKTVTRKTTKRALAAKPTPKKVDSPAANGIAFKAKRG